MYYGHTLVLFKAVISQLGRVEEEKGCSLIYGVRAIPKTGRLYRIHSPEGPSIG